MEGGARIGRTRWMLVFVAGVWLAQQLSALPPWPSILATALVGLVLARWRRAVGAALLLGAAWAMAYGTWHLQDRLTDGADAREYLVVGRIASLPERFERGWRFDFDSSHVSAGLPSRLRLSWYEADVVPKAGDRWRLRVRLKPPHGSLNPGGFDYEGWLFAHGIGATGYVRPSAENARLAFGSIWDREVWRQFLADRLDAVLAGYPFSGLVKALVLGDESGIIQAQWDVLRRTGTAHLVAISGSHIALVAGLVYVAARRVLAWARVQRWPPPALAAGLALLAAFAYAALADFAIPTRRALVMAAVALGAVILQRHTRSGPVLALALFAVVLLDPLAVLSPGFWLSFAAVALILLAVAGRLRPLSGWQGFLRANLATGLGLTPLLLLFFQQAALVSPIANLLAIPVLGMVAVPWCLVGTALLLSGLDASGWMLRLASSGVEAFWPVLERLAEWPWAEWHRPAPPWWAMALAGAAVSIALMPRGLPGRWLALPLLMPALTWQPLRPDDGDFDLTLLDVGQGLSVAVATARHALVFDAGARMGTDWDMGRMVVEPYLRHVGIGRLDALVVSHGDNDHVGGAYHLLRNFSVERLYTSVPALLARHEPIACVAGQGWEWDGVAFAVLSPFDDAGSENDRSCVLKITGRHGAVLLTGDIEKVAETALVARYGDGLASAVLVAPHHGSRTSSSEAFLRSVAPRWALIPAGYRNRFGFPHGDVLTRYRQLGIAHMDTGRGGALQLHMDGTLVVDAYRQGRGRYWNAYAADFRPER